MFSVRKVCARAVGAVVFGWLLMAAGCGGGGGDSTSGAPTGGTDTLTAAAVTTSLDAYPANTSGVSVSLASSGYFPFNQGDSWVFDNTSAGSTTVGGITRMVVSGPDGDGHVLLQELEGPYASVERYTVVPAGITEVDPLDAYSAAPGMYQDFPSWTLYSDVVQKPGIVRTLDRAGSTQADFDGDGKMDTYRLHADQVFKGFKTITVLGQPTQVAHFVVTYVLEFRYTSDNSTSKFTLVQSEAFASGLGLVATERVVVRDGVELSRQRLALRAAHVAGVDHGVSSGHLDKTGITQIIPSVGALDPNGSYYKASITLTLDEPVVLVKAEFANKVIATVSTTSLNATHTRVDLLFKAAAELGSGTFNDTLTITACEDQACKLPATGSPFTLPVSAIVGSTRAPESGLAALEPARQQSLTHDVIAAKYSRGLNRVVMVSGSPSTRLYLMDPTTGVEQSLALSRVPTSLALSPDGSEAAVGHDGRITWVKLDTLAQAQPEVKLLDLSAKAYSLALDASRHVYVVPESDQWVNLRTVDVSTNVESTTTAVGGLYAKDSIVVRHDGHALYTQYADLSTSALHAWTLQSGVPVYVRESDPVAFDNSLCPGTLWMSNDDSGLVTGCGVIVKSSPGTSNDLVYKSTIPLTNQGMGSSAYRLRDLSQNPVGGQWAAIEYAWYDCGVNSIAPGYGRCFHHLNVYDDDSFALREKWGLGPVAIAGLAYDQDGVAVFHSADGQHLYLITRLRGMGNPSAAYLFQVVR